MKKTCVLTLFLLLALNVAGQQPWEVASYPYEEAYREKMEGQLERIASLPFGVKSMAHSKCPDTGLPVKTWALEGETIYSPYTGRAYVQGYTGYFGPKARGEDGRILAFGGDPLKKDLPPALATLLLDPENEIARNYLSIPGNLRQQYHFACRNWCRFYPLLGEIMGAQWNRDFEKWIAVYNESRRPSDGDREHAPMSTVHNLVGEAGELLGGNTKDGGTENHKTMWRTSALLYAELLPEGSLISGYSREQTKKLVKPMLTDYIQRCLQVGNGEYDSEIYYPYSIDAYLNLFDFSPDSTTRLLAKTTLDYYLATAALKTMDGELAGGQKRGSLPADGRSLLSDFLSAWDTAISSTLPPLERELSVQLVTTGYRPNRVLCHLMSKQLELPFEATFSRPYYHMNQANAFQEYFYSSRSYAMGSVYMSMVDNPNQQIVWSLVARGKDGALRFGGLQPFHRHPSGHSPYTQTLQKGNCLIVATGPTVLNSGNSLEERQRERHAFQELIRVAVPQGKELRDPEALTGFFEESQQAAATWFFIPKQVDACFESSGRWFVEANETFLCLHPLSPDVQLLSVRQDVAAELPKGRTHAGILRFYDILVIEGGYSGYVLECAEASDYGSIRDFEQAILEKGGLEDGHFASQGSLGYRSLDGDLLHFEYQNHKLRCKGSINGQWISYENWNKGYVCLSPYLVIGKSQLWVSDGKESYQVDYRDDVPVYRICDEMPDVEGL